MRPLLLVLLLPLLCRAETPAAIRPGEFFQYRVNWGVLLGVGEIKIAAPEAEASSPVQRVTIDTASHGLARMLYPYVNHAEVSLDRTSGALRSIQESGTGFCKSDSSTEFDYTKNLATHVDRADPRESRSLALPSDHPVDLISALLATRHWRAQPGDQCTALAVFDGQLYPVTLYAIRVETINTHAGRQKALLIIPRMDPKEARGLFKRGGEIKVWVTQDDDPQPVRMQLKLNFGTATLQLVAHTLPSAAASTVATVPVP